MQENDLVINPYCVLLDYVTLKLSIELRQPLADYFGKRFPGTTRVHRRTNEQP